jgi:hypothetical protein
MNELREMTYALGQGVPTPPKTRIKRPRTPPKGPSGANFSGNLGLL